MTLSLRVAKLNSGISADALQEGLPLPASVRSVEDHGYTLDLGIKVCRPQAWHDITSISFASFSNLKPEELGSLSHSTEAFNRLVCTKHLAKIRFVEQDCVCLVCRSMLFHVNTICYCSYS